LGSVVLEPAKRNPRRKLHALGVYCGLAAAVWLAAAEAPIKLVAFAVTPTVIAFMMVFGAFLSRWSIPALVRGTAATFADARQAPHLIVWGLMAGCLWAVADLLTIYAIRDIGLSIAFPIWNTNSLIGIVWGALLFGELRRAGWLRWLGVAGGAVVIFAAAIVLTSVSISYAPSAHALHGVAAALGAGLLFGSQYIPYRKAYISGMNPLTFLTFFTFGEMATMSILAICFSGGVLPFWHELLQDRTILFWPLLGGFFWVIGDLFQNYAAKYVGISRGIPLSNTNQIWGLLWATMVFGELHGLSAGIYMRVIGGTLLMTAGAIAIACASTSESEYTSWKAAAQRECDLYDIDPAYVHAQIDGAEPDAGERRRGWADRLLIGGATLIFVALAMLARVPEITLHWGWLTGLSLLMFAVLAGGAVALWRTTRFR